MTEWKCSHDRVSKNGRCLRPGCKWEGKLEPTPDMATTRPDVQQRKDREAEKADEATLL